MTLSFLERWQLSSLLICLSVDAKMRGNEGWAKEATMWARKLSGSEVPEEKAPKTEVA